LLHRFYKLVRTYAVDCFCGAFGPAKTIKPIESSIQVRKSCWYYLTEVFARCYSQARSEAVDETKLPIAPFPEQGSFAEVDVLTERCLS
jgi:hypothetical protein